MPVKFPTKSMIQTCLDTYKTNVGSIEWALTLRGSVAELDALLSTLSIETLSEVARAQLVSIFYRALQTGSPFGAHAATLWNSIIGTHENPVWEYTRKAALFAQLEATKLLTEDNVKSISMLSTEKGMQFRAVMRALYFKDALPISQELLNIIIRVVVTTDNAKLMADAVNHLSNKGYLAKLSDETKVSIMLHRNPDKAALGFVALHRSAALDLEKQLSPFLDMVLRSALPADLAYALVLENKSQPKIPSEKEKADRLKIILDHPNPLSAAEALKYLDDYVKLFPVTPAHKAAIFNTACPFATAQAFSILHEYPKAIFETYANKICQHKNPLAAARALAVLVDDPELLRDHTDRILAMEFPGAGLIMGTFTLEYGINFFLGTPRPYAVGRAYNSHEYFSSWAEKECPLTQKRRNALTHLKTIAGSDLTFYNEHKNQLLECTSPEEYVTVLVRHRKSGASVRSIELKDLLREPYPLLAHDAIKTLEEVEGDFAEKNKALILAPIYRFFGAHFSENWQLKAAINLVRLHRISPELVVKIRNEILKVGTESAYYFPLIIGWLFSKPPADKDPAKIGLIIDELLPQIGDSQLWYKLYLLGARQKSSTIGLIPIDPAKLKGIEIFISQFFPDVLREFYPGKCDFRVIDLRCTMTFSNALYHFEILTDPRILSLLKYLPPGSFTSGRTDGEPFGDVLLAGLGGVDHEAPVRLLMERIGTAYFGHKSFVPLVPASLPGQDHRQRFFPPHGPDSEPAAAGAGEIRRIDPSLKKYQ